MNLFSDASSKFRCWLTVLALHLVVSYGSDVQNVPTAAKHVPAGVCIDPVKCHNEISTASADDVPEVKQQSLSESVPGGINEKDLPELLRLAQLAQQLGLLQQQQQQQETAADNFPNRMLSQQQLQQASGISDALRYGMMGINPNNFQKGFTTGALVTCCFCSFITAISLCLVVLRIWLPTISPFINNRETAGHPQETTAGATDANMLHDNTEQLAAMLKEKIQAITDALGAAALQAKQKADKAAEPRASEHAGGVTRVDTGSGTECSSDNLSNERLSQEAEGDGVEFIEDDNDELSVPSDSEAPTALEEEAEQLSRWKSSISRAQRPETKQRQKELADKCRSLFTAVKTHLSTAKSTSDAETRNVAKRLLSQSVKDTKMFFERVDEEFDSAASRITAMIYCCNVVVEIEGLDALQTSKAVSTESEQEAQWVIEKLVPHIWGS